MRRRAKLAVGGVAAAVAIGVGSFLGIAAASGGDEQPLSGGVRDQAAQAALAHVGGGTVTEVEAGDGGAAYEVEVKRADGSQVEVNLNSDFAVTNQAVDDDGAGDQDGGSSGDD